MESFKKSDWQIININLTTETNNRINHDNPEEIKIYNINICERTYESCHFFIKLYLKTLNYFNQFNYKPRGIKKIINNHNIINILETTDIIYASGTTLESVLAYHLAKKMNKKLIFEINESNFKVGNKYRKKLLNFSSIIISNFTKNGSIPVTSLQEHISTNKLLQIKENHDEINLLLHQTNELREKQIKNILLIHFVKKNNLNKIPKTVLHNLDSFKRYSKHKLTYINFDELPNTDLEDFDTIIMHYYSQIYTKFSSSIIKKFAKYKGTKIFFSQDDYDYIHLNRKKYLDCKIDILYTPANKPSTIDFLYPPALFKNVKIYSYLTGYCEQDGIPPEFICSYEERDIDIFYRGNDVGLAYGNLGLEKYNIGIELINKLSNQNLNLDISCKIIDQVYGDEYYQRMGKAKATLITESGSSIIFDCPNLMEQRIEIIQKFRGTLDTINIEELKKNFKSFFEQEGKYILCVISPKAFEAIKCKTLIIGFEGEYSDILIPNKHYIPLKKDYSNLIEIIEKIKDKDFVTQMTECAYNDIILSGKYSYKSFIHYFDKSIIL